MFKASPPSHLKLPPRVSLFDLLYDGKPCKNRAEFQLKLAVEYGDFLRLPGFYSYYTLSHPHYIQHVLHTNYRNYRKNDLIFRNGIAKFLGQGLLSNDDDALWAAQRQRLQPIFQASKLQDYAKIASSCTQALMAKWQAAPNPGRGVDIFADMLQLAFKIAAEALFSGDFDQDSTLLLDFTKLCNHFIASSLYLVPWLPTPKNLLLRKVEHKVNRLIQQLIQQRRQQFTTQPQDDLLGCLLNAQQEPSSGLPPVTDQLIIDEIKTFILTGHETLGLALGWTWHCLAQTPACWATLQSELNTVLNGRPPVYADLPQLNYTRRVLLEALRLYPPVWITTRRNAQDDQIGDFFLPAGARVLICPYAMHRHPNYWPNPNQFDPDRHLTNTNESRAKYTYLPFGLGPHTCIGANFALTLGTLIIAALAQQFTLVALNQREVNLSPQITLHPKNPIRLQVNYTPHS